jgi:hypothetical protein
MKTSETVLKIMPALIKAQGSIKHAQKDAKNPHFKNTYATLESVIDATKEILLKQDITVVQTHTPTNTLVTTLYHASGEYLQSEVTLFMSKQDMQQLGSSTTYARRYSLASMLNIAQEDDDGNATKKPTDDKEKPMGQMFDDAFKKANLRPDPENFVFPFGKFKGKKLIEMSLEDIDKSVDYWEDKKKAGSISHDASAFLFNAIAYLQAKGFYPPTNEQGEIK